MQSSARIAAHLLLALGLVACSGPEAAPVADAAPAGDAAAAAAAVAATPEPAPAPAGATESDPRNIELDMPRMERFVAAMAGIAQLKAQDPSLEEVIEMDANEDLDTYVARLEGHPQVSAAIEAAGATPREFALTSSAFAAAMFVHAMMAASGTTELPESMNPQHVEFVKAHQEEIAALMQAHALD